MSGAKRTTVKDLIEMLQKLPQDMVVAINHHDACDEHGDLYRIDDVADATIKKYQKVRGYQMVPQDLEDKEIVVIS